MGHFRLRFLPVGLALTAAGLAGCTSAHSATSKRPLAARALPTTTTTIAAVTTVATAASSTTAPAPSTTTSTTRPARTSPAVSPTATTAAPPPPPCQVSHFTVTAKTDKATYATGDPISITVRLQNAGSACTENDRYGYGCLDAFVDDTSNQEVWNPQGAGPFLGCPAGSGPTVVLAPGWSTTSRWTWNQIECGGPRSCTEAQAPPGQYHAFGTNGSQTSAPSGAFTIVAPPTPSSTTSTT